MGSDQRLLSHFISVGTFAREGGTEFSLLDVGVAVLLSFGDSPSNQCISRYFVVFSCIQRKIERLKVSRPLLLDLAPSWCILISLHPGKPSTFCLNYANYGV
jgi:hypothetical protein